LQVPPPTPTRPCPYAATPKLRLQLASATLCHFLFSTSFFFFFIIIIIIIIIIISSS